MQQQIFDIEDTDPFGEDTTPQGRPTARRGTQEWKDQLIDYALSGARDMDTYAASKASSAGKGRRKKPNFWPYCVKHYQDQGVEIEKREVTTWMDGFPMTLDYLGLFDGVIKEGGRDYIGVQVCSKEGATAHIRKMCSSKKCLAGNRRSNLIKWLSEGKRVVLLYFFQDGGKGTRWLCAEREVTTLDIETVIAGRDVRLVPKETS